MPKNFYDVTNVGTQDIIGLTTLTPSPAELLTNSCSVSCPVPSLNQCHRSYDDSPKKLDCFHE